MILGAGGMLGTSIAAAFKESNPICLGRNDLDITCFSKVRQQLYKHKPDYLINCAAYTAVDQAEEEPEKAFRINYRAVELLSQIAREVNAVFIHFSTDYVFDGTSNSPYKPEDKVNPLNVYGRSKWLGEEAIRRSGVDHYIFRISWLYAPYGKNFYTWVLDNKASELSIVETQVGCPTSVEDVTALLNQVLLKDVQNFGTYHFTGGKAMSWFAFAKAIVKEHKLQKNIVPLKEYPSKAKRPSYSVIDDSKTRDTFFNS
jgi:dTDP-4-dehydrorhamnose reductase